MEQGTVTTQATRKPLVWSAWLLLAAVAICTPRCLGQDTEPNAETKRLQLDLDADGYLELAPGLVDINAPLRVRAGATIRGTGYWSKLRVTGHDWAIIVDDPAGSMYGVRLEAFHVINGGVLWREFNQTCGMDGVWVSSARLDAFRVEGLGERLGMRDCVAWGAQRYGFAVVAAPGIANNGVVLDRCNAQNNGAAGLLLATAGWNAQLEATVIRDCTIQGNQRRTLGADIQIVGYVGQTVIEHTWVESPGKVALRAEPATFSGPFGLLYTRRPGFLRLTGTTRLAEASIAAELIDCHATDLDCVLVTPSSRAIQWSVREPGGAKRMLQAGQVQRVEAEQIGTVGGT